MKIKWLKDFLNDKDIHEAFITGPAGSGKTTLLKSIIKELKDYNFIVTAFTHKAKEVLLKKLPNNVEITTLHSYLKKRPYINQKAMKESLIKLIKQFGDPDKKDILIVDEFSFINDDDYSSICDLTEDKTITKCPKCEEEFIDIWYCPKCDCDTIEVSIIPGIKVIFVGDLNQLPPVKSECPIYPMKPYWVELKKVHRSNKCLQPYLNKILKMKETGKTEKLIENNKCLFRVDDFKKYFNPNGNDKILAWTNEAVQYHNFHIAGKNLPSKGDVIYCSQFNQNIVIYDVLSDTNEVITPFKRYNTKSKYNPLNTIKKSFKNVLFLETNLGIIATVFGSYNYKIEKEKLAQKLVKSNKEGKDSKKAYKLFKTFDECVVHTDFPYAATIHKAQGQEWDNVFIDNLDLSKCKNLDLFFKLLYVSFSRAKNKIYLLNKK